MRGFSRGLWATLVREVPGNAIFFMAYESLQASAAQALGGGWATATAPLSGGLAGMALWGAVLPLDNAKTCIQLAVPGGRDDVGVLRVLRRVHAEHGLAGLYAGARPVLVRAFVANAAQWVVWELAVRLLRDGRPE